MTNKHIHTYMPTHLNAYIHTFIHTYIPTYKHTQSYKPYKFYNATLQILQTLPYPTYFTLQTLHYTTPANNTHMCNENKKRTLMYLIVKPPLEGRGVLPPWKPATLGGCQNNKITYWRLTWRIRHRMSNATHSRFDPLANTLVARRLARRQCFITNCMISKSWNQGWWLLLL